MIGDNGRLQYLRFCLFEMYVNVVFVIRCLCSAVSLTLVRKQRFVKIIIVVVVVIIIIIVFYCLHRRISFGSSKSPENIASCVLLIAYKNSLTRWITPKMCRLYVCVIINKRSLKPFMCLDLIRTALQLQQ